MDFVCGLAACIWAVVILLQEAREDRNQARALQARAQAMVASAESKAEVLTEAGRLVQSRLFGVWEI